jgi:hypothetical protein
MSTEAANVGGLPAHIKQQTQQFNTVLGQYKGEFANYEQILSNIQANVADIEKNARVENPDNTLIPELFPTDIDQTTCIDACKKDDRCKYVLFSDSGNGQCAANKCLKYTEEAAGLLGDATPTAETNRACAGAAGPATTSYVFSGWSKPTWSDEPNRKPNAENVNNLGTANSLLACKEAAERAPDGPYAGVVFYTQDYLDREYHNKCYGVLDGESAFATMTPVNGVITSIYPENVGPLRDSLSKLRGLNTRLTDMASKLAVRLGMKRGAAAREGLQNFAELDTANRATEQHFTEQLGKLQADRAVLEKLDDTITTLESLGHESSQEKRLYQIQLAGWVLILAILVGIGVLRFRS